MLINLDAKSLEWVCAAYLSQDKVALKELETPGFDLHSDNQKVYELPAGPDGRLIAKIFLFRMIFGGSAWSYANDAQFQHISEKPVFWQGVIDKTYQKYQGLAKWHTHLQQQVSLTGRLEMPTGRVYTYERKKGWNGEMKWPTTTILNYPVQGFGADLLSIIRISLFKQMKSRGLKSLFVCTVHDSILIDALKEEVDEILEMIFLAFDRLPSNFEKIFGKPFNVRLGVEVQVGYDWKHMQDYKKGMKLCELKF